MNKIALLCACLFASPAFAAPEVKLDCMTMDGQHFVVVEQNRIAHIKFDATEPAPAFWLVRGQNIVVIERVYGNTLEMVYNVKEDSGAIKTTFFNGHVSSDKIKCNFGLTGK